MEYDGRIDRLRNLIHYSKGGGLSENSVMAKGFFVNTIDIDGAGVETANEAFRNKLNMLLNLKEEIVVQVQFGVTNDFRDVLDNYQRVTDRMKNSSPWSNFCRTNDRAESFRQAMNEGRLRRERTAVFIIFRCLDAPNIPLSKKKYKTDEEMTVAQKTVANYLDRVSGILDNHIEGFENALKMSKIIRMTADDLIRYTREWFQPSLGAKSLTAPISAYQSEFTIRENFETTGFVIEKDYFLLDGFYHCVIVTRTWPEESTPYTASALTRLLDRDIRVTQTVFTIPKDRVIANEKTQLKFSINRANADPSNVDERIKAQRMDLRLSKLISGGLKPHRALTIIHFWARSEDELRHKRLLVTDGLTMWGGLYKSPFGMQSQIRNLTMHTMAGFADLNYSEWGVYASSEELAGFFPLASGYLGDAMRGHAIYDTPKGGILGVACFIEDVPLHTFISGRTRSGKSMMLVDYLSQTAGLFSFSAIIDRGNTHGLSTKLCGERRGDSRAIGQTFRFGANTKHVINYFDTQGAPLSRIVRQTAAALTVRMAGCGERTPEQEQMRLSGIISHYIEQLYDGAFATWANKHEDALRVARRTAFLFDKLKKTDPVFSDLVLTQAYAEMTARGGAWVDSEISKINEKELIEWLENPFNRNEVKNLAFAFFTPTEFPTHSKLVEIMSSMPDSRHDSKEIVGISEILKAWTAESGLYGQMFDGYTNVDLKTSSCVHCELGDIPQDRSDMLQVAYFLVTGFLRQRIFSMPRSLRKRIVFEEIGTFAALPQGAAIMAESASQFAKSGCQCIFVGQQYSQIAKTAVKSVIVGNCDNYLLFAQNEGSDLQLLQNDIGLPESAIRAIDSFVIPANQPDKFNRGAYFLMMRKGDGNIAGVGINKVSQQMIYVGASAGKIYDDQKRLASYEKEGRLFDGVMDETARMLENQRDVA